MVVEAVDGTIQYLSAYGAQRSIFRFKDVLHFRGLSLDGLIGLSGIQMAKASSSKWLKRHMQGLSSGTMLGRALVVHSPGS